MRELNRLVGRIQQAPELSPALLRSFVRRHTFPLVDEGTATFFFWDGEPTEEVKLVHWVFGLESAQELVRIPGTDAFYLSLELPRAGRVEYKLALTRGGHTRWVRDPLNPRRAFDPFGSNSVCTMGDYHDPRWVEREPAIRRGRIEEFTIRSRIWGDDRTTAVYLPAEYRPHKRYPVVLCHDGGDYRKFANIRVVLDNLIHRHEVAPIIVAFTTGHSRNEEYAANPRQAAWLVEELLPELESRYGLSSDPADRGVMGASFGAVSSLFTAWTYPGVFGRLLLQSGSFVFTDVGRHDRSPLWDPVVGFINTYRTDPSRIGARVFMSCGTFESLIAYNRGLYPLMRASGLDVRFVESQDGHNWIAWRDRLRDGLTWLFPGHLWMIYD